MEKKSIPWIRRFCAIKNENFRCFLAEVLGTFVFLSFSFGGVAQFILGKTGDLLAVNVSFGFGLTIAIVIAGKVSEGHFNPAVSFAFLILGRMSVLKFFIYVLAQNLGAFIASIMVYLVYYSDLTLSETGMYSIQTSTIFATLPHNLAIESGTRTFSLFMDQFLGSILFIVSILAICDERNNSAKIPHVIKAVFIGITLMIVSTAFGLNGFAVNPARDFAPRMFTLIFGWGAKVFTAGSYFFWIPVVAPMIGAFFAVVIYSMFIGIHLSEQEFHLVSQTENDS